MELSITWQQREKGSDRCFWFNVHLLFYPFMARKTISTGTLGLRFMQNARRAKQLEEVELERAQVKDDAQWEVAQEVRDAWGLAAGSSS